LTGWLLMPLLFMLIEQDMGQRCFAGKSPAIVSKAAFCAGIGMMFVCVVPIVFGVFAKSVGLEIPEGASVLMTAIVYATNPWIAALAGCAILAAIISTASSLINAFSSNLSQDFEIFREQKNLRVIQTLTLILSLGALGAAFYFNGVVDILIQSYELFVSAVFVPIFMVLLKKRRQFLSGLLSISFGIFAFCLFKVVSPPIPSEIASILLSWLGYGLGEVFIRLKTVPKMVKEDFE
jgi:SSS family solute:Na+ symporter